MTSKRQTSIITVASIAAIVAIASGVLLDEQLQSDLQTVSISETIVEPYDENAVPLHLREHRSGLAVMDAVEIENPNLDVLTFQKLTKGQFDFIWRAINNGATYVSDTELMIYSEQIKEPNHRFIIEDGESVKYYRIGISSPPLNYEKHYVKVFEFAEERDISFKALSSTDKVGVAEQIDRPYRWTQIDEQTALDLTSLIEKDGTFFTSFSERGPSNFQLQYLGSFGEEFNNPDFVNILAELQEQRQLEQNHHEEDNHE